MAGRQRARNAISSSERPILSPLLGEEVSRAEDLGDGIIRGALPWLRCDQDGRGAGWAASNTGLAVLVANVLSDLYIS